MKTTPFNTDDYLDDPATTKAYIEELRSQNARLRAANERLGSWMSAALDDPGVCEEMKDDIRAWFDADLPTADDVRGILTHEQNAPTLSTGE